ncbi:MAG: enoyl-CoA hydratase/isomerase family protein [Dehalococcoidia bacterium]|nr:enoyl-CoA hydratase/isomerase family protein [Dehalococcoidia bacterium]
MATYEHVLYESAPPIVTVTLNRPAQMNALSRPLEAELHAALDEAAADPAIRAIIVTGAGPAFSAGYDLGGDRPAEERRRDVLDRWVQTDWRHAQQMMHIMELPKPVIAAVNGWCLGGGFWISLACDITIASEQATFGQPEVRMISNSSFLFPALVGWKNAHRYALTGDHFDAQEALRIGAVNEVVPHDELMDRARAMAARLALVPPDSVRMNKALTIKGLQAMGLRTGLEVGGFISTTVHSMTDAADVEELYETQRRDGLRAFLQQRDGPFLPEPGGPRSKPRS